jgi:predicted transcriptional regulator
LEFRKLARTYFSNPDRYGALTREEIEGTIAEIDAALSDTSEEQTNG